MVLWLSRRFSKLREELALLNESILALKIIRAGRKSSRSALTDLAASRKTAKSTITVH
jgi:hypothetical protein